MCETVVRCKMASQSDDFPFLPSFLLKSKIHENQPWGHLTLGHEIHYKPSSTNGPEYNAKALSVVFRVLTQSWW